MDIIQKQLDEIRPYASNPRNNDAAVDPVAESIKQFGFKVPIVVDKGGEIINGHTRYKAAKKLGLQTVPVIVADDLTQEQIKAFRLADNKVGEIATWDTDLLNEELEGILGIFKGVPITREEFELARLAREIYEKHDSDGKYILNGRDLIVCQSNTTEISIDKKYNLTFNPLGFWTGGPDVDTGATNRKLGSDMARSVTGGGLHGKDLSKADVSVNIYAFLEAQRTGKAVELCCAIGDEFVGGKPYSEIVGIAKGYIDNLGGFEKLAEWGLV